MATTNSYAPAAATVNNALHGKDHDAVCATQKPIHASSNKLGHWLRQALCCTSPAADVDSPRNRGSSAIDEDETGKGGFLTLQS